MKDISINDLTKIDNPLLIDVRIPSEYIKSHLNKFINIPANNILTIVGKYPKNSNIVLYCDFGHQSNRAGRMLKSIGYTNIFILKK